MKKLLLIVALLLSLAGCKQDTKPSSGLPTVNVSIGGRAYTLEIASTEKMRAKGLMERDAMEDDRGMIFVFTAEEPRRFWMKNTRIPLDILYLGADGKIISIHQMKPYDQSGTESKAPAKFAIELNVGEAEKSHVKEGDAILLPDNIRSITAEP